MSSTSRPPHLLYLAFWLGLASIGLAVFGLQDWEDTSGLVERGYAAVGLLLMNASTDLPSNRLLLLARVSAMLFWLLTVAGVLVEISPDARNRIEMAKNVWRRCVKGKPLAVVIGLGWVGGPLAAELRRRGRPVVGIALDEESPRVAEARDAGVHVLLGDANDDAVRRRAGLRNAAEVFIATGDDGRNLDLAGDLLRDAECLRDDGKGSLAPVWPFRFGRRLFGRPVRPTLQCHVHVGAPAFRETVERHGLLEAAKSVDFVEVHTFSALELAARQLFLDSEIGLARRRKRQPPNVETREGNTLETFPRTDQEVFHLFLVGDFGQVGQAIALAAARLAHFPNGLRTRLTVFADAETGHARWEQFLARHPAFSPDDLTLTDVDFLSGGDAWTSRPGQPIEASRHTDSPAWVNRKEKKVVTAEKEGAVRVCPIEYAVNAEFAPLPLEPDAEALVEALVTRLRPNYGPDNYGPDVLAACVLAFDEERRSYQAAVRLQAALAPYAVEKVQKETSPQARPIRMPIYVYLPVEKGLEELLEKRPVGEDEEQQEVARNLPLRAFGQRREVAAYERIAGKALRERARQIRSSYRSLSPHDNAHPDFSASDDLAAQHADVKLDALGITFTKDGHVPSSTKPLLEGLMTEEVRRRHLELEATHKDSKSGKLHLSSEELECLPEDVRQRLALLGRFPDLKVPGGSDAPDESEASGVRPGGQGERNSGDVETPTPQTEAELRRRASLHRQFHEEGIARFEKELGTKQAEIVARMEHNRWMGERLAGGWQFGSRCNVRRQRVTFVPWAELDANQTLFDRAHLPGLILREGPQAADLTTGRPSEERFFAHLTQEKFL